MTDGEMEAWKAGMSVGAFGGIDSIAGNGTHPSTSPCMKKQESKRLVKRMLGRAGYQLYLLDKARYGLKGWNVRCYLRKGGRINGVPLRRWLSIIQGLMISSGLYGRSPSLVGSGLLKR